MSVDEGVVSHEILVDFVDDWISASDVKTEASGYIDLGSETNVAQTNRVSNGEPLVGAVSLDKVFDGIKSASQKKLDPVFFDLEIVSGNFVKFPQSDKIVQRLHVHAYYGR